MTAIYNNNENLTPILLSAMRRLLVFRNFAFKSTGIKTA